MRTRKHQIIIVTRKNIFLKLNVFPQKRVNATKMRSKIQFHSEKYLNR